MVTDALNPLVVFELPPTMADLFSPENKDDIIAKITAEVRARQTDPALDVTTPQGRGEIVALAYKVTRTKTAIDKARKDLVAGEKRRLAAIDGVGREIWEALERLAADVRAPVTAFEAAENNRIAGHKRALMAIDNLALGLDMLPVDALEQRLEQVVNADVAREEFTEKAVAAQASAIEALRFAIQQRKEREAELAELQRLRTERAEADRLERERRVAEEAERRVRTEAEARERALEEQARAAEQRAADAARQERARIETERLAKDEADRMRRADETHHSQVLEVAHEALVKEAKVTKAAATAVLAAIDAGRIPHVTIQY